MHHFLNNLYRNQYTVGKYTQILITLMKMSICSTRWQLLSSHFVINLHIILMVFDTCPRTSSTSAQEETVTPQKKKKMQFRLALQSAYNKYEVDSRILIHSYNVILIHILSRIMVRWVEVSFFSRGYIILRILLKKKKDLFWKILFLVRNKYILGMSYLFMHCLIKLN